MSRKRIVFAQAVEEVLRRKLAIGYLPNVKKLNGSVIDIEERETAQRAFIRHYMNQEQKPRRLVQLSVTKRQVMTCDARYASVAVFLCQYRTETTEFM
jgi:hypothetical protein